MRVSAIMPSHNQPAYIDEAVNSVIGQVDELIVVDDASTPPIKPYPHTIHMRNPENQGTAEAINKGFWATNGELLTWVSSDNIYAPDWREKLEAGFEDDVGVVYSAFRYGINGRILHTPHHPDRLITQEACYYGPSFLMRREVWAAAGPHRGLISHDYDHWLRVEETCWEMGLKVVDIPDTLCTYRVHDERVTVTRRHQYDAKKWQARGRIRREGIRSAAAATDEGDRERTPPSGLDGASAD